MASLLRNRLYARCWDLGNPIFAIRPDCPRISNASTFLHSARRSLSQITPLSSYQRRLARSKDTFKSTYLGLRSFPFASGVFAATSATPATISSTPSISQSGLGFSGNIGLNGRSSSSVVYEICHRKIHTSSRRRNRGGARRHKSSITNNQNGKSAAGSDKDLQSAAKSYPETKENSTVRKEPPEQSSSYIHLPHMPHMPNMPHMHMPKMPHRPTKEELLAAANGFFSRLKVRFKWLTIRSTRPWNVDDWSAFVSWFVMGNLIWIFVGTTTFFSLIIYTINTVVAQETLARWVGDYLTYSAGVKVVFESAIVPKWGDGVITFRNVFVSRRPGQGKSKVSKGSSSTAAAAAAATEKQVKKADGEEEEDTNYTQFDVTIDTVNVTLSFVKWWNGKGLLKDVEIKGVRGVMDRTSVHWSDEYEDPRIYKHEHQEGDFEIDQFKLEDVLLTIHQPGGFRPFSVSIFNCELPQLRKQWLFYDFLSANNMSGAFDGSLFTIHPRQIHGFAGTHPIDAPESFGGADPWKKHSRLRIDGLKIDHLNRGVEGPFSWIYEGNVDIVADVMFPADSDESIAKALSDVYDRLEATVTSNRYQDLLQRHPSTADLDTPEQRAYFEEKKKRDDDKRFLVMDLKVSLNDVRAAVPLFTRDLSYINHALIRPIVAYINSKKTFIPINCRVVKRASEFDGSWTIFDSGLMEDLSAETYEAFAKDVTDSQARMRRLKKVGLWSFSLAVQALFMGLAGNVA